MLMQSKRKSFRGFLKLIKSSIKTDKNVRTIMFAVIIGVGSTLLTECVR